MRTERISNVRPIVRRGTDDKVVAWVFRLTLEQWGIEAFDDVTVTVAREIPFTAWTQSQIADVIKAAITTQAREPKTRVASLHRTLDNRVAVIERRDLDIGGLPA